MPTLTPPAETKPQFRFDLKARQDLTPGGLFYLVLNDRRICEYQDWAFASCGVASLLNFKAYAWDNNSSDPTKQVSNFELLDEHHVALFEWLKGNAPTNVGRPEEFLMVLGDSQIGRLPKTLKHPCVREIDHFLNKFHGYGHLHLYRISLRKDFKQ